MRQLIKILTSLVLMFGLLISVAPVAAGGGSVRAISGTISAIDVNAKTVTIAPKAGSSLTVTVAITTIVKRNGSKSTLDKLQIGDKVEANYGNLTKVAMKIEARTNQIVAKGSLVSVDLEALTITVTPSVGGSDLVLTVDANTLIRRMDLIPATLENLLVGDLIDVKYNPITYLAYQVDARIPLLGLKGSLSLVEADKGAISITQDVSGLEVVLSVDTTTLLTREGQTATIAALVVGDRIEAKYNPLTMLAYKVAAWIPQVQITGSLKSVDATTSSLTITQDITGTEITVSVDTVTVLKRMGVTVALADLQVGDRIIAKYNPLTNLASLIDARIPQLEVKGTIQAINATAGELTVKQYTTSTLVTLQVDSSTIIRRGSRKIALSALRVGNRLEVKYNPLTLIALRIDVK